MTRVTPNGLMVGREQDLYPERFQKPKVEKVTEPVVKTEAPKKRTYTKRTTK